MSWLDHAKALGILLVLLGHQRIEPGIVQLIFSFHVPLFFFLSGFVFDSTKYQSLSDLLRRKVRTLLIPYFAFAIVSYLFWLLVVRNLSVRGASLSESPLKALFNMFYAIGAENWQIPMAVALWFLPCLFLIEMGFGVIAGNIKGKEKVALCLLGSAMIGYLSSLYLPFRLPWSLDVAFTGLAFFGAGYLSKEQVRWLLSLSWIKLLPISVIAFVLTAVVCFSNGDTKVDMNYNVLNNVFLFYVTAFAGIIGTLSISGLIRRNHFLSFVGSNTLIILGLSGIAFFCLNAFYYLLFQEFIVRMSTMLGVFLSLLQVLVLVPVMLFANKCCPWVLGRNASRNNWVGFRIHGDRS